MRDSVPWLEVPVPEGAGQGGWYLLQGRRRRRGGNPDARLYVDTGQGWALDASLPVPTSVQGAINEVVRLPAGVRRVAFAPGAAADFELELPRLTRLRGWLARLRMGIRVAALMRRLPSPKLALLGLSWSRLWRDLPGAYDEASKLRAHAAAPDYADWIARFDTLSPADVRRIRDQVASWDQPPAFHVQLVGEDPAALQRSRASIDGQLHRAGPGKPGSTQWTVLLHAGDVLAPHALYWFAAEALAHPDAAVIYADEDRLDAGGRRCDPRFLPDWSWAHARSTPFFGAAVAIRADALALAGGWTGDDARHGCYDAVLRALDALDGRAVMSVRHIPAVLLHRAGAADAADPAADAWGMEAVRSHLARHRMPARVEPVRPGCWRVRHALPAPLPKVSIIVPTRDALALTRRCIESVRERTRYANCEILLVDNQSSSPEALAWMREQDAKGALRLLHYDAPFNYSAINNMAVAAASGDIVCLLNNDTEVVAPDWLEEMVGQLLQPGVDVVGAKLLYDNGMVQHAGDLVGVGGVANHAFAWLPADAPGYCSRALVAQEYSAVTAACLVTWRRRFLDLGGLDARHLPVAFNDVDYCLRVREAGGRVVWTPHAVLLHHESVSRGVDQSPAQKRRARREAAWMRRRWRGALQRDPFYNPNLSHERPDFSLSHAPLVRKPWQS